MKSTGIVRKVDELVRIVLPIEFRRTLEINEKDPLEIFVEGQRIILSKYENSFSEERLNDFIEVLYKICDKVGPLDLTDFKYYIIKAIKKFNENAQRLLLYIYNS